MKRASWKTVLANSALLALMILSTHCGSGIVVVTEEGDTLGMLLEEQRMVEDSDAYYRRERDCYTANRNDQTGYDLCLIDGVRYEARRYQRRSELRSYYPSIQEYSDRGRRFSHY